MIFQKATLLKIILILGMYLFFTLRTLVHVKNCYRIVNVSIEKPTFSLLGPYDTTEYKLDDVYDQLIDLKNFSFIINSQPCQSYRYGLLLIVIIHSKPDHFKRRSIIRHTWGKSRAFAKVVFLLGQTDNITITKDIEKENIKYGDMIQGSFTDSYRNLTYKNVMGLKWVSHHCPGAKYVLKSDDDVVINSFGLWRFLARTLSPWGARDLIACEVYYNKPVERDGKWRVTEEEFAANKYPAYCGGFTILYSRDVVPRLLSAAQKLPFFWVDDVQVTGIAAQKIGVAVSHLSITLMSGRRMRFLIERGIYDVSYFVFAPPDLTSQNMSILWKFIPA